MMFTGCHPMTLLVVLLVLILTQVAPGDARLPKWCGKTVKCGLRKVVGPFFKYLVPWIGFGMGGYYSWQKVKSDPALQQFDMTKIRRSIKMTPDAELKSMEDVFKRISYMTVVSLTILILCVCMIAIWMLILVWSGKSKSAAAVTRPIMKPIIRYIYIDRAGSRRSRRKRRSRRSRSRTGSGWSNR